LYTQPAGERGENIMKKNGMLVVALLLLQPLWFGGARAADAPAAKFNQERSKQETIYHSVGEFRPDGYVIDRSLSAYAQALPAAFDTSLSGLGAKDRWLDIGAGEGQAVLDYASAVLPSGLPLPKAQAVAMSIEDRRTAAWHRTAEVLGANQIRYLYNKRLGEYSPEDIGRFQIISDVIGGFSYTENISVFMEKVLSLLELNGSFFSVLQDVHWESGTNKPFYAGAPFLTTIKNADGTELSVCAWLKSISCVAVSCEGKTGWKPLIETYSVRKVCNDVRVPALVPTHFAAGTPPERAFQIKR